MSINSAMLAGVTGLTANSQALAAISDNIANVNTVGYKRTQANFQTLVTGRSATAAYSAGGVAAQTRRFISTQGLPTQTSRGTDLSISGQGFFVVTEKSEDLTAADARSFTRAGSFQLDSLGYLRNDAGLYLQGWLTDENGVITTDPSDITRLKSINVSSVGGAAEPTSRIQINANLNSETKISNAVKIIPPATAMTYSPTGANSMANYNPDTGTGTKPDFSVQVPVSDSKGGKRTVTIDFLRSNTPNQWYAEVRAVPAGDVDVGAPLANGQLATGVVAFTQDGRLDPNFTPNAGENKLFADFANPVINFAASDAAAPGAGGIKWNSALGIGAQQIRLELGGAGSAGGLTSFSSESVLQSVTTNGTAFGNLTDVEIDDQGYVTAIFDNGITRRIAQVAIATFPNADGLIPVNGNAFRVSRESGTYNFKTPGSGGAGYVAPSTLESSTVDLSTEFTGLITTQRAYSASSKIITTADQMLEELLNIKR
ncbi:flagellar hook protein FlgE [Caulobacter mirabilis]|uniref:Flagellar hook protein FlgE n=1 Tax=Caulobacter mirabilis TaxID=69666 RepID=A0A2D2AUZ0_9CAUL|nr:flagellar hook protein FlgE [Caulobacter mirabilis]ATQ41842.1 transposase [Caulobacter mirabilis]